MSKKKGFTSKEKTCVQSIVISFVVPRRKEKSANVAVINNSNESNSCSNIKNINDNNNVPAIETPTLIVTNNVGVTRFVIISMCILIIKFFFNNFSSRSNCAGKMNSVHGKRKHQISIVHKYALVDPNSTCEWENYLSFPAPCEKECNRKDAYNAVDSGLACY